MRVFFIALFFVFAVSGSSSVKADDPPCTCTPADFQSRWQMADAVFMGTVKKIEIIDKEVKYGVDDLPVEVTFLVDEAYKSSKAAALTGDVGDTFTLHTNLTRRTCAGHPFEIWNKYLVFAYVRKDSIYERWSLYNFPSGTFDVGGLCGGTKKLSDSQAIDDLKHIDQLKAEEALRAQEKDSKTKLFTTFRGKE